MRGSIRIGSLLGIPLYIHWTFFILIAWFLAGPLLSKEPGYTTGQAINDGLWTAGFILAIFGCVVLHEMGHALAARRYGIPTRDITLLPIGGIARLDRMPERPGQELVVAAAGPAVNVVLAAIIIPGVLLAQGTEAFTGADSAGHHRAHFLASLGVVNVFLVLFNLIPAFPMDGGRMLRAILAMMTDRATATTVAARVGQVLAVGFAILGLFAGNIFLMLIAVFVFLGAGAEAQAEQFRSALGGLPVRAAAMSRFRTLRASQPLREAAAELLAGSQQDFPVLADDAESDEDASALVGVLTRSDLVRAIASGDLDRPVSEAMSRGCPVVSENDNLRDALDRARVGDSPEAESAGTTHRNCPVIAVTRSDGNGRLRLVGLVTQDNVAELVMLRSAAQRGA